jgi:hypothetical protein
MAFARTAHSVVMRMVSAMTQVDMDRIGGLQWTRRTGGHLTAGERLRLLGAIAIGQLPTLVGFLKLAVGYSPAAANRVDVGTFEPPNSRLAREAESACAEQPPSIVGHSYRTWMFGLALAVLDGTQLDRELFYCAALLHDYGLASPTPGRDFTLKGAERAIGCAIEARLPTDRAESIADSICVHATPGISVDRDGPHGSYLQFGAMVDVGGIRLWDIAPHNRQAILQQHPRDGGFKKSLVAMIGAEARAVPGGRFALLRYCGLTLAVRVAPIES